MIDPVIKLNNEVFPAPLGPIIPNDSFSRILKLRLLATLTAPNDLHKFLVSRIFFMMMRYQLNQRLSWYFFYKSCKLPFVGIAGA